MTGGHWIWGACLYEVQHSHGGTPVLSVKGQAPPPALTGLTLSSRSDPPPCWRWQTVTLTPGARHLRGTCAVCTSLARRDWVVVVTSQDKCRSRPRTPGQASAPSAAPRHPSTVFPPGAVLPPSASEGPGAEPRPGHRVAGACLLSLWDSVPPSYVGFFSVYLFQKSCVQIF